MCQSLQLSKSNIFGELYLCFFLSWLPPTIISNVLLSMLNNSRLHYIVLQYIFWDYLGLLCKRLPQYVSIYICNTCCTLNTTINFDLFKLLLLSTIVQHNMTFSDRQYFHIFLKFRNEGVCSY